MNFPKIQSLQDLMKPVPKKERYDSEKKRRKYNLKNKKWAQRMMKQNINLVGSMNTLCLDCGKENFGTRLGCSCHDPSKLDTYKGVVYGVHIIAVLGNGFSEPVFKESAFVSTAQIKERLKSGERFVDYSIREEITLPAEKSTDTSTE